MNVSLVTETRATQRMSGKLGISIAAEKEIVLLLYPISERTMLLLHRTYGRGRKKPHVVLYLNVSIWD